jgi:peptide/nickel transport system substrate-binding protein
MTDGAGPWGTGPYKLVEGFSLPEKRSDRVVLEANTDYWDPSRFPRLQRIVFDNTLSQKEAVELVKTSEGRVDLVTELSPLETLRVAQSAFAKVVKNRESLWTVFGQFNMRKVGSPWHDVRLRRAVNVAINREDFLRYATKGNGVLIPALLPVHSFGQDPHLVPYPFDPGQARHLLREAGYPDGLSVAMIAPEELEIQATVVSKMLEQAGFTVDLKILDSPTYNQQVLLSPQEHPPEHPVWDIALASWNDPVNFPLFEFYHNFALGGAYAWVSEEPALRQLYEQAVRTVDRERQQALMHQMEQQTHDQAYFLFLYNPIKLYAVNKAVEFVPYVTTTLNFAETSVTEHHWSVRKQKAAEPE